MKITNFNLAEDLLFILTILKEEKILNFDKQAPHFLLGILYEFLWNLLYKAKILSKYKEKKGIDLIDIKIALILKSKTNKYNGLQINNIKHILNIINKQKFPDKTNTFIFKFPIFTKSLANDECKIFGNILS